MSQISLPDGVGKISYQRVTSPVAALFGYLSVIFILGLLVAAFASLFSNAWQLTTIGLFCFLVAGGLLLISVIIRQSKVEKSLIRKYDSIARQGFQNIDWLEKSFIPYVKESTGAEISVADASVLVFDGVLNTDSISLVAVENKATKSILVARLENADIAID